MWRKMAAHPENKEDHGLLTDVEGDQPHNELYPFHLTAPTHHCTNRIFHWIAFVSLLANIAFILFVYSLSSKTDLPITKYANLQRNHEEPYVRVTPYSSDNDTLQDQLWHSINVDYGVVALSDAWAARHGLRAAQRFPWDPTKGIYILHGFHNLHCLKVIHMSLSEHRRGATQSRSRHHVDHCLDALRRQVLCDADDTPRATDRRREVVSGLLQHRKCRSWKQLEDWARQHTACYKHPEDPERDGSRNLHRFKHCPPGTGYVVTDDYVSTEEILSGLPEESLEGE
ncbi:hypothetical protein F4811DRAFT_532470 [Daldinia bambusicola]|nr:hypothetical protein F4811DRAFT_532470 [Daldinia bambusicola]